MRGDNPALQAFGERPEAFRQRTRERTGSWRQDSLYASEPHGVERHSRQQWPLAMGKNPFQA